MLLSSTGLCRAFPATANAADLSSAGLLLCDPEDYVLTHPESVYNTPSIVANVSDPTAHVVTWAEGKLSSSTTSSYYFVEFSGTGASRACDVKVDGDGVASYSLALPSPSDASDTEAVRAAPVVLLGSGRTLYLYSVTGHLNKYALGASGFPSVDPGDFSTDTTPESDPSIYSTYDPAGPDSSVFIDPNAGVAIAGYRCAADPTAGITDCEGDSDPTRKDAAWGEVHAADLNGELLSIVDLNAWTFSAPVGLSSLFNENTQQNELLTVLGTLATTTGASSDYDCALVTMMWDGSSLLDPPPGVFNDGETLCDQGSTAAVDGFTGEPVPYSVRSLFSLRYYGKLYRTTWNTTGSLTKVWDLEFINGQNELRVPAEMSPVIGTFPETPTGTILGSMDRVMFGMNEYDGSGALVRGLFLNVDPTNNCILDPSQHCVVDPDDYLIDELPSLGSSSPIVWAPGAAAVYRETAVVPPVNYLAFVTATGAITYGNLGTSALCEAGEVPPQIHIYYQRLSDPRNSWQHDSISLFDPTTETAAKCYEEDPPSSGNWVPITVISGVTVQGASAYIATNDGRFWEYNTQRAKDPSVGATRVLEGYSGPWPRFRKNNLGQATAY